MISTSLYLIRTTLETDSIGQQKEVSTSIEVPIIKIEDIYSNEFYEANNQGYKPELRVRISALNYDYEQELEYNGIIYNIIRTQTPNIDEVVLICERKLKNVRQGTSEWNK